MAALKDLVAASWRIQYVSDLDYRFSNAGPKAVAEGAADVGMTPAQIVLSAAFIGVPARSSEASGCRVEKMLLWALRTLRATAGCWRRAARRTQWAELEDVGHLLRKVFNRAYDGLTC